MKKLRVLSFLQLLILNTFCFNPKKGMGSVPLKDLLTLRRGLPSARNSAKLPPDTLLCRLGIIALPSSLLELLKRQRSHGF